MVPATLLFKMVHPSRFPSINTSINTVSQQLAGVFNPNIIPKNLLMEGEIYRMLTNSKNRWTATEHIASTIGLTYGEVNRILNNSDKFVSSTNRLQEQVIATRERFRKEEPIIRKIIGAFRYRID